MSAQAAVPRYVDDHLAEGPGGAVPARPREELFIHLGLWERLTPGTSPADLRAAQRRLDDHIVALSAASPGLAILDVGCGFGGTIASFDAAVERLALVGVNIDPRQLRVAQASVVPRGGSTVRWLEGDACALPLPDASFDRVVAVECAFHFASRRRFLAEIARVLRPGGRLALSDLVATPDLLSAQSRGLLPTGLEEALRGALAPCEALWRDEGSYPEMAAAAGLDLVSVEDATLATLPSYACILKGKLVDFLSPAQPAGDKGVAALAWLQTRGLLRVEIGCFQKAG